MNQSICTIDGCEKLIKARGVCGAHYYHLRIAEDGNCVRPTPTNCPCGAVLMRRARSGPAPTYCSKACRSKAGAPAAAKHRHAKVAERRASGLWACQWDGCGVALLGREKKWCAEHRRAVRRLTPKDSLTKTCSEPECDRAVRSRGICHMHWRRLARAEGREANAPWGDRQRQNKHVRRARMNGASKHDKAWLSDIVERDGTDCSACRTPVDFGVKWPHPKSKSVDHTIPLSKGGTHTLDNTTLMHLECNLSKGARVA